MAVRVGINGFGRIGRQALKALLDRHPDDVEVVAINDLFDTATNAHLFKYDSNYGNYPGEVEAREKSFVVDGHEIQVTAERDPANIPWKKLGAQIVIESTGFFTDATKAKAHVDAGAEKVIISAPARNEDITIVLGVNDGKYDAGKHHLISNASCTTNSLGPMAKILLDTFGIESGFMTTIHAYTTEQQLQDQISLTRKGKPDLRRMRSAPLNIVPASTGAAKAIGEVIPEVKGKLDGMAMRVPVPDGSVTDLVAVLGRAATADEVNTAFSSAAAEDHWAGILEYTEDPIVSSDIVGNPASCIIDGLSTMAHGNLVKVIGWYDNEWGYSCRLVDLIDRLL